MHDIWTIGDGEDWTCHLQDEVRSNEMIDIPRHPDYSKNFNRPYREDPDVCRCCICGRPCPEPRYMLNEHCGGGVAVTEQEAASLNEAADLGMQAIGADCLKKHPELKPYVDEQIVIKPTDWKRLYFDLFRQMNDEDTSDHSVMQDAYRRFEILRHYK